MHVGRRRASQDTRMALHCGWHSLFFVVAGGVRRVFGVAGSLCLRRPSHERCGMPVSLCLNSGAIGQVDRVRVRHSVPCNQCRQWPGGDHVIRLNNGDTFPFGRPALFFFFAHEHGGGLTGVLRMPNHRLVFIVLCMRARDGLEPSGVGVGGKETFARSRARGRTHVESVRWQNLARAAASSTPALQLP